MKKLLLWLFIIFGVLSVISLFIWAGTADQSPWFKQFNVYTLCLAFCAGVALLSFVLSLLGLSERGLPVEYLRVGTFQKTKIIGELKAKESPTKEDSILLLLGKKSSDPVYVRMPKSDFVKIDLEGNTLQVSAISGHTLDGKKVKVRQLTFSR